MKAMHMVKKEVLLDINGRNDHIAQHVKEHLEEYRRNPGKFNNNDKDLLNLKLDC